MNGPVTTKVAAAAAAVAVSVYATAALAQCPAPACSGAWTSATPGYVLAPRPPLRKHAARPRPAAPRRQRSVQANGVHPAPRRRHVHYAYAGPRPNPNAYAIPYSAGAPCPTVCVTVYQPQEIGVVGEFNGGVGVTEIEGGGGGGAVPASIFGQAAALQSAANGPNINIALNNTVSAASYSKATANAYGYGQGGYGQGGYGQGGNGQGGGYGGGGYGSPGGSGCGCETSASRPPQTGYGSGKGWMGAANGGHGRWMSGGVGGGGSGGHKTGGAHTFGFLRRK